MRGIMRKHRSIKKWIRSNAICLFSFLVPTLLMLLIFILRGIYPFGDGSFMHSDMYHQYVPFLTEFQRKFLTGDNPFYSWNVGMGTNFLALYIYYCASPFNWLVLLVPSEYIIEFMSYMVIFKIGLCGFTFSWYLTRKFKTRGILVLFFSVFYAMSGFVAAYNWNVMWMDCIFLAPLILLGLERLVKTGKCKLYCIALALSILSNYYLSIMICIFLVLYFIVLLLNSREKLMPILRFAGYSLLAGGMAAVLLLPELAALSYTEFSEFNFPDTWRFYFHFMDMFARHCVNVQKETGLDHWPNIFCGSAVFFLLPLYAVNPKIKMKEKVAKLSLLVFMLLSFSSNILTFIWHGLNYPDSLPSRQSFLYIFLMLAVCFEAVLLIRHVTEKQILKAAGLALFFILLCERIVDDDAFSPSSFFLTAVFILFYAVMLYLYRKKVPYKQVLAILVLGAVLGESTYNMMSTSVSTTSRSKYLENHDSYRALVADIREKDPNFYRFEKFSRVTKNDGALVGYPTASLFSSTANAYVENMYGRLGMSESKVFYCFDGATPLTSALLNVHYMFSKVPTEDPDLYELIGNDGEIYLYRNRYTLPTGFVLDPAWELESADLESGTSNPLEVQNRMAASMGFEENLFIPVDSLADGNQTSIYADTTGHYYAFANASNVDKVTLSSASKNKTFSQVKYDYIMDLGRHEAGEEITLTNEADSAMDLSVYRLNEPVLAAMIDRMGEQAMDVTSFDSTHLSGEITVETPGRMVISVAYEPGWTLMVDGVETKVEPFDHTLVAFDISEGTHTISLSYYPAGLNAGIVISILSVGIFVFICIRQKRTKSKKIAQA